MTIDLPTNQELRPDLEWQDIVSIIDRGELWRFFRRPSDLSRYRAHIERVEKLYGSIRAYALKEILGWDDSQLEGSPGTSIKLDRCQHTDQRQCQQEILFSASNESGYFVQETPFPYAVSSTDVKHYVVWSKRPLLHPCAIEGDTQSPNRIAAWRRIRTQGLTGLSSSVDSPHPRSLSDENDAKTEMEIEDAIHTAGKEIRKFVTLRWGENAQVAWFANPPSLQSLPALAHWHCMVRQF